MRQKAESLAFKMTAELERLAQAVRHTNDAVVFTDLAGKIEGPISFVRMTTTR